jgi:ATP-dependent metalloprotease FtsH
VGSFGSYAGKGRGGGADENRKKSDHFEVLDAGREGATTFQNVGGYDTIKRELEQCIDILTNYTKYARFNVRVPKGLLLEGPPGNGKTLLAKALSGEANTSFIAVSGAEFQDKYVGVGSGKIRELFQLATENRPCIIFIDEIDALGKKRSGDGEGSSSERDNTLNELLVAMDGFKNTSGIFVIGATNRADMLDPALLRPGRMDKKIYIGNPDTDTRRAILDIHRRGKPFSPLVAVEDLVYTTEGLSGAQIENLLNEAMLNALKGGVEEIGRNDIDTVMNKIWGGWQPNEHAFSPDMMERIAIHEMGHAIVGLFCKYHSKVVKVVISLSSPTTPGYTIFESPVSKLHLREGLFEKLAVLLAGRIAEEMIYDLSITTGAVNDFQQVVETAEKMVRYYGMGKELIYPVHSEKYKEKVDTEIAELIQDAYFYAKTILEKYRYMIEKGAGVLLRDKVLTYEGLVGLIDVDNIDKENCDMMG